MKTIGDQYDSAGSTAETMADLVFCAFIVLVLFVLTLAVEVSMRVRADEAVILADSEIVVEKEIEEEEEVADLANITSKELEQLKTDLAEAREQAKTKEVEVKEAQDEIRKQMSAMQGEQRFTGATEPAIVSMAFDYRESKYYFIRSKESDHAITRMSGESDSAYYKRAMSELRNLKAITIKQRSYSRDEVIQILSSLTKYKSVNAVGESYDISDEETGITYVAMLSALVAGDDELTSTINVLVERGINMLDRECEPSDAMRPTVNVFVDDRARAVNIGTLRLTAIEFRNILLAFGGRGIMLDFEGYDGPAPRWLTQEVLNPTGYISKTPKIPN